MKSLVAKFIFAATVVAAPVVGFSQINKTVTARQDMTLLTGPHLLSTTARPLAVETISSERVQPATLMSTDALEAARQKRSKAETRLKQLRAERAAAFSSKQAELETSGSFTPVKAPTADYIRFDAQLPATPTELLRAAPLFKRD